MAGYKGGGDGRDRDGQIYVGNLPPDVKTRDIEDLFYKFGKINFINLKDKNSPPFAFIEFDDPRDAQDAIKDRDGYNYDGYSIRVERPRGERGRGGGIGGGGGRGASFRDGGRFEGGGGGGRFENRYEGRSDDRFGGRPERGRGRGRGRGGSGPQRRSEYRILITGLPPTGSWQDLKDHLREAGDICYADSYGDGTGVVEFLRYDDMKYAVKKMDDTKFKSHEGESSYIRIKEDYNKDRSRSRSRSDSHRRTR